MFYYCYTVRKYILLWWRWRKYLNHLITYMNVKRSTHITQTLMILVEACGIYFNINMLHFTLFWLNNWGIYENYLQHIASIRELFKIFLWWIIQNQWNYEIKSRTFLNSSLFLFQINMQRKKKWNKLVMPIIRTYVWYKDTNLFDLHKHEFSSITRFSSWYCFILHLVFSLLYK